MTSLHQQTTTTITWCIAARRGRRSRKNILATNTTANFLKFLSILRPHKPPELYGVKQICITRTVGMKLRFIHVSAFLPNIMPQHCVPKNMWPRFWW